MSHVQSGDVVVDGELGFRVLRFPQSYAVPFFARVILPTLGAECRLLWYDYSRSDFFELTGSVAPGPKNGFNLHLEGDAGIALVGAPVFTDQFVMGIVASGPHPDASTSMPDGTFVVEVISVAGMAESKATPVVSDLLRRLKEDRSTQRRFQSEVSQESERNEPGNLPAVAEAEGLTLEEASGPKDAIWERLSGASREAFARADGIRRALKKNKVHTEYLIAGLFPEWKSFFERWNVTEATLSGIVHDKFHAALPTKYSVPELDGMPTLSKNAREAVLQAAQNADERGSKEIRSSHLLYGALSLEQSKTAQALREIGVQPGDLRQWDRDEPEPGEESQPAGRQSERGQSDSHVSQIAVQLNAETLARLSQPARGALERAEGMRAAGGLEEIHMEQLIAGLLERGEGPMRQFFAKSQIDEPKLHALIHEVTGTNIPERYPPWILNALPPLSKHARKAMRAGVRLSVEEQTRQIESRHLLSGALSVDECKLIKALKGRGVRQDDIKATSSATQPVEIFYSYIKTDDDFRKPLEKYLGMLQQEGLVKSWSGRSISVGDRAGDVADPLNLAQLILLLVSPDYLKDPFNVSEMERAVERQRKGEARVVAVILRPIGLSEAEFPITGLPTLPEGRVTISEFANYDEGFRSVAEGLRRIIPTIKIAKPVLAPIPPTPKVDSDLWSERDCLGYEAYARTIASLITHPETRPPLTIGIKAPWGAGKTSLMKRVQHLLDGYAPLSEEGRVGILQQMLSPEVTLRELLDELKIRSKPKGPEPIPVKNNPYNLPTRISVWFNAWKYQTSEQIWAGMAHCIISQVTARMGVKERELFWLRLHGRRVNAEEVRKRVYALLLRKVAPMAAGVVAVCFLAFWLAAMVPLNPLQWWRYGVRYGISGASLIWGVYSVRKEWADKLGEKAAETMSDLVREPGYEGKMGYLHLVESDMREVLQLATEKSVTKEKPNGDPLVVFVDDLDRCAPNKVAEVVEAINLFLCGDYPNCIFVLGMEPGMVAAALEVANNDVIEKAQKLGLLDRTAPVGWRFMEKIVQLPIVIPPPTDTDRRGYVHSLTGSFGKNGGDKVTVATSPAPAPAPAAAPIVRPERHGKEEEAKVQSYRRKIGTVKSSAEAAQKAAAVAKDAPVEERWAALEAGNRVYEQALTEGDPVMAEFANRLSPLVDGNPRQIKRYVNVFRFYSALRYRLGPGAMVPRDNLPTGDVLAKFVELSIRWPHAVDCLRVRVDGGKGTKISLLKRLEAESRKPGSGADKADEDWKRLVGNKGLGLPEWVQERAFREFLSGGELLCETEGHGLW
jgi:hypothetical protein